MPLTERKPAHDEGRGKEKRRPYETPRLVEYGPVTKLTQNMSTGSIVDGNGMMMTCL